MTSRLAARPARAATAGLALAMLLAACGGSTADDAINGDDGFSSTSTREDTVATAEPERSTDTPDEPGTTTTSTSGEADGAEPTTVASPPGAASSADEDESGSDDSDESTEPQRTDKVVDDGPVVVVAFEGVLGWWDGAWHQADEGVVPTEIGDQFDIVTLDDEPSIAIGGGVTSTCPFNDTPGVVVGITGPTEWFDPVPIAVHNAPDLRPRSVTASSGAPQGYDEIAAEYLVSRGLNPTDASVVQFLRADLEGDRVDETFLVIEKMTNELNPARPGDYSIAVMRQVADGEVRTIVIDESLTRPPSSEGEVPTLDVFRFAALADLDADGDFEIALNSQGYEGSSTAIYDHDSGGQPPTRILIAGCGV